ncbi:MAG: hypothetical protein COU63_04785 [Candidatus Pacebacteria bacterium CG10_big_fil_rev_8_21_14_0_10_36_11]|nr:DMT family transporter [Candidatus Pacearchaeota archaeon]OIP73980.1 MAG: hypothetical protein AUK08_01830 [Candidatus Pacebacteria bacterium CG2_30_36_39]PIR64382.1 MAG: hypothetical protein COU63_04785 [Candidatus Pacebacteria bacterium CG10_big_fil_rev_8_21_14_0_10_36_11]PJC43078.1 MAG: hypothetical protein CO040_01155 [Candidatus Pacebacteria bacterium CG_4_9_14_0_2_um_filter_36_8]
MSWILASLLMFSFSVASYLLVRLAGTQKTATPLKNLSMFIIPAVIFLIIGIFQHTNFAVTPFQLLIIFIMSIFFSYLGNVFSLKSIELAPNPGFSLVISKSYVVFTSIASVFLFQDVLTVKAMLAIGLIIAGSGLIMIEKKATNKKIETNKTQTKWLFLAIGAFFCWGMLALTSKYLLDLGVNILSRLVFSMIIVSIIISTEIIKEKIPLKISKQQILTLLGIGISGAGFNYFMQLAYQTTPNVGYINAINAASIAAVAILSGLIFKDELNFKKLLGVGIIVAGLALLVLTK